MNSSTFSEPLEAGVQAGAFPGAVAFAARGDQILFHEARGVLGVEPPFDVPVTTATLYDLASLTKLVLAALVLRICREHGIALNASLSEFLPNFDPQITLSGLLTHTSGLHTQLQTLSQTDADDWIKQIARWLLESAPGERVVYNCANYFLLGRALVQIEGAPLDRLIQANLLEPANLAMSFVPESSQSIAPTEKDENGEWLHGVVNDPASRSFRRQTGDSTGNSGLFATAETVAKFAQLWHAQSGFFHPDDLSAAFRAHASEANGARGLSWQLNHAFYMGNAPRDTAGHLGFTGTSLVWHPASQTVVVMLSNRVHPTSDSPDRMPFLRAMTDAVWQTEK